MQKITTRLFFIPLMLFALLSTQPSYAQLQSDTTIVQTFSFDTPNPPAWGVYRGSFDFPQVDPNAYRKVLMYYTLKCDAATNQDNYPCGEWDYLTYTYVVDSTGLWDSTRYVIPNFTLNGNNPAANFAYTQNPTYSYTAYTQNAATYTPSPADQNFALGNGSLSSGLPFGASKTTSRSQYIWRADELAATGLTAGAIHALTLDIAQTGSPLLHLTVRIAHVSENEIPQYSYLSPTFTTVYDLNTSFENGQNTLFFSTPFAWNGSDNLLIEFLYDNTTVGNDNLVRCTAASFDAGTVSRDNEACISFTGSNNWADLGSQTQISGNAPRTIEMWARAELFNDAGIFQAGKTGAVGEDFSFRTMSTNNLWRMQQWGTPDFNVTIAGSQNTWHHYCVVYDGATTYVYYDGVLKGQKTYNIQTGVNNFWLARWDYAFFKGQIDEVRIWNAALSPQTIADWYKRRPDSNHPNFSQLRAYFPLNEGLGSTVQDVINNYSGQIKGSTNWLRTKAINLNRNFEPTNLRPNIQLKRFANSTPTLNPQPALDSLINQPLTLMLFNNPAGVMLPDNAPNHPKIPTDTLTVWTANSYVYTYNLQGNIVDSTYIAPQVSLTYTPKTYYSPVVRYELGRYITPYGINLDLGPNGFTWVFDVTDYAPLLRGTVYLEAGNAQELLDLKFAMISGTPVRPILGIKNLYSGNFNYTDIWNETVCQPQTIHIPSEFKEFRVNTRITGHDFPSPSGCGEFCPKDFNLAINQTSPQYIWNTWTECGNNPVYPQGGTWIFDRGGWCPGDKVHTFSHEITPYINSGSNNTFDFDIESPAPYAPQGNYVTEVQLISYGEPTATIDVAVEDIIAPSNNRYYARRNPICGKPIILIKNNGKEMLSSLMIEYGVRGLGEISPGVIADGIPCFYRWEGQLLPNETTEITLPNINWTNLNPDNPRFYVQLTEPNYGTDEYTLDNAMESSFNLPPRYDSGLTFRFKTNAQASENSYTLRNAAGNIVYEGNNFTNNTTYDEVFTLENGCYILEFTDSDDDGLSFWYNNPPYTSPGEGHGYARLVRPDGNGNYLTFDPDFGHNIYHNFTIGYTLGEAYEGENCTANVAIEEPATNEQSAAISLNTYPNPANDRIFVQLVAKQSLNATAMLYNILGELVYKKAYQQVQNTYIELPTANLPVGVYQVVMQLSDGKCLSQSVVIGK